VLAGASETVSGSAQVSALPTSWPFAPRSEGDRAARARVGVRLGLDADKVQFAAGRGWATERPLRVFPVHPETQLVGLPRVDLEPVLSWWRARVGVEGWLGEPLMLALLRAFVSDLVLHDPASLLALRGRPVLLLANHQNYLESALLTTLLAPVLGSPIRSVAKTAHQGAWLDQLANLYTRYQNAPVIERIVWFDPNDRASLVALAQQAVDRPLLVHVEGTRQTEPDQSIEKFSSIWLDLALQRDLPVIPVAFRGGVTGAGTRHDVPPAAQIHHVGAPILPATLAALPHAERRQYVARAIDALGRPEALSDGSVRAPGAAFTAALRSWSPDLLRLAANPPSGPTYAWLRQLQQLLRAGEG
jgi:1-acyl-sn-glycerol-3-phosphate acyltransferase